MNAIDAGKQEVTLYTSTFQPAKTSPKWLDYLYITETTPKKIRPMHRMMLILSSRCIWTDSVNFFNVPGPGLPARILYGGL